MSDTCQWRHYIYDVRSSGLHAGQWRKEQESTKVFLWNITFVHDMNIEAIYLNAYRILIWSYPWEGTLSHDPVRIVQRSDDWFKMMIFRIQGSLAWWKRRHLMGKWIAQLVEYPYSIKSGRKYRCLSTGNRGSKDGAICWCPLLSIFREAIYGLAGNLPD